MACRRNSGAGVGSAQGAASLPAGSGRPPAGGKHGAQKERRLAAAVKLIPAHPLACRRWALAELNLTLAAFTHTFAEQRLLESHSFSRCPKRAAYEKLLFSRGCTDAVALQQQPQLQAAGLLLDTALAGCADAAISQVALKCPPFLQAWASRWLPAAAGAPPGAPRVLRLMVLAGYRAQPGPLRAATVHNLGLPTIVSAPAATTIYVPCA